MARRNLAFSVLSEHIGFSMWSLWSAIVLFLGPKYHIDAAGKFTLTAVPTVVGAALRLPYTFAVAKFGGRNWTIFSTLMLLVPAAFTAVVLKPGVSYTTLLIAAALAGVGGGNFASSMANINNFYPIRLEGLGARHQRGWRQRRRRHGSADCLAGVGDGRRHPPTPGHCDLRSDHRDCRDLSRAAHGQPQDGPQREAGDARRLP